MSQRKRNEKKDRMRGRKKKGTQMWKSERRW